MPPTTVLLVDDHAVMRMGLVSLLRTCPELAVTGEAGDGESGLRTALEAHPDVIIADLMMPGMDGITFIRELLARWPQAKVLILTTFGSSDALAHALQAGARGVVLKSADLAELRQAIAAVARGQSYVSDEIEQILSNDPPLPELTRRQGEILESCVRGLSNADIARQLGISLPMVKEHLSALFQKLGAANRTEAVAIALRRHLLTR